ncbi:MAG: hypothetical protein B6244_13100 [Candidatus Cloacimonetes bacterium 4572_55]|nr:MAG: hypothetical protein B6244_13100 [Candidatus Cloacimonetes bacterium 4572_55]
MAKAYKFGTFSGVFTPSILTILGVIMYLRLGFVVGHAGLLWALAIIVVAHFISVPTGLSVSSIATDKKVKAGGVYYIISRSLGLSIGGALGIALYVGMAFSIALYIIGFCESFNIFIGLDTSPASLRLVGSLVLIAITTLAFISSSLAIKAQFFIMGAIILSLISILFGQHALSPESVQFASFTGEGSKSLIELFGIFFPAVTGFTAGVSMSGDLKDPRRSIPIGTMLSIGIGFVVYIFLAIFMALTIDAEYMRTDNNIMLRIAWFSPFVTAGIWGATLSSALGSILGAPRILQALSVDKIAPKFFGSGYGPGNEPRNALIFTAILAEFAIMLGELDTIARVVSMFYLTTYGFLNLTCAVESWASPDFRPDFKIPIWVSLVGALVSFFLMILLDPLAMIGATFIMIGIFLYLKRKELGTDADNTWDGVWASIVRTGLFKLDRKNPDEKIQKRNWRPNIILFSGGTQARPHLIEFGKWLAGSRGLLSDFELVESPKSGVLFPKEKQSLPCSEQFPGIFSRRLSCRDIYEGMEVIARSYGFSGMEPNAVMMGWARHTSDPHRFAQILKTMKDLDYNILMLDYDARFGFGEKKQIDIWWRGAGNNVSLALMLVKFILLTDEWRQARVRVLIMNMDNIRVDVIYKNMQHVLEETRISATVKVIDNTIEQRSFLDIIRFESKGADLILIGLPDVTDENAGQFIENMNNLLNEIGTVLLTRASSYFEEIFVGIERTRPTQEIARRERYKMAIDLASIELPQSEILAHALTQLIQDISDRMNRYCDEYLEMIYSVNLRLIQGIWQLLDKYFQALEKPDPDRKRSHYQQLAAHFQNTYLRQSNKIMSLYQKDELNLQVEMMKEGASWLLRELQGLTETGQQYLTIYFEPDQMTPYPGEPIQLFFFKLRRQLAYNISKRQPWMRLPIRIVQHYFLTYQFMQNFIKLFRSFGVNSYQNMTDLQKSLSRVSVSLYRIESRLSQKKFDQKIFIAFVAEERQKIGRDLEQLQQTYQDQLRAYRSNLLIEVKNTIQMMSHTVSQPEIFCHVQEYREKIEPIPQTQERLVEVFNYWAKNQALLANLTRVDLNLSALKYRLWKAVQQLKQEIENHVNQYVMPYFDNIENRLRQLGEESRQESGIRSKVSPDFKDHLDENRLIYVMLNTVQTAVNELPERVRLIGEKAMNQLNEKQFEDELDVQIVPLRQLTDYVTRTEFVNSVQEKMIQLSFSLKKTHTGLQEMMRLTLFNLTGYQLEPDSTEIQRTADDLLKSGTNRVALERKKLLQIQHNFENSLDQTLNHIFELLNPYLLARSDGQNGQSHLQLDLPKMLSSNKQSRQNRMADIYRMFYKSGLIPFFGMRSHTPEKSEQDPISPSAVQILLKLNEELEPNLQVLSELPFYYTQMFTEKTAINKELWIGRKEELSRAKIAIRRFRQGIGGGLLIIGGPNSGKSSFASHVAARHFDRDKIFLIKPPLAGSIEVSIFKETLEEEIQTRGKYSEIFSAIPSDSALIFDELELWWERSRDGMEVIKEIMRLINRFGDKCTIFAVINSSTFQFIDRFFPIRHNFLDVIECRAFSADDLKELILRRHRATGLRFEINGSGESFISEWRLIHWFTKLTDYTKGNVGLALQAWLNSIESVRKETIFLRKQPAPPNLDALEHQISDWIVILLQFILHKRLTISRMNKLSGDDESVMQPTFFALKRAGILVDEGQGIFRINPRLEVYIRDKFIETGAL